MRRIWSLLFSVLFLYGCAREELMEQVAEPRVVYERMRTVFDRRADSTGVVKCLGELRVPGASSLYVILSIDSSSGTLQLFSSLRQKLGWIRFSPDTVVHSFEAHSEFVDPEEFAGLNASMLVGQLSFPENPRQLKVAQSRQSFHIALETDSFAHDVRLLKEPLVVQSVKIRRGESQIELHFRNYRKHGTYYFPHLLFGSTPLGRFELRFMEIRVSYRS
ncbi:hypothetical protein AMJ40_03780 [candidate division TA06 bacterium DG_26]|uniref:Uncharacterized protein n=1 Tax=candidate division TA06 bacterium DG_26 TaxID=1703771 RepID=A0A0S7WJJ6_UNCT6|nr:MAG: hypothetical protein AMJ40_03780 [candidate division TA06 bacterium DG_26]